MGLGISNTEINVNRLLTYWSELHNLSTVADLGSHSKNSEDGVSVKFYQLVIFSAKFLYLFSLCVDKQSHLYQGRTNGCALFLLACIHPVTSCSAGSIFHPSTSSGSFGSPKQAAPCMQARIMCAYLFYLGIDDFGW